MQRKLTFHWLEFRMDIKQVMSHTTTEKVAQIIIPYRQSAPNGKLTCTKLCSQE